MRAAIALSLVLWVGCALRHPAPVCHLDVDLQLFPPWQPKPEQFDLALWSSLLLRGNDRDCTGRPYAAATASTPLAAQNGDISPLQPATAQLAQHSPDEWLIWLRTHRTSADTLVGPVARVKVAYEDLRVMAIGRLEARDDDVALALVQLPGLTVLQVHSGSCPAATGPTETADVVQKAALQRDCQRDVYLLPQHGGRFLSAPGGAISLRRRAYVVGGALGPRTYVLEATMQPKADGQSTFDVQEQVLVFAGLNVTSGSGDHLLREGEGRRTLRFDGASWLASDKSLWDRFQPLDDVH